MHNALFCLALAGEIAAGTWTARLDAPHGPLQFGLEVNHVQQGLAAVVVNGSERIDVPLRRVGESYVFDFPHYAATLTAKLDETGRKLDGEWSKRAGPDTQRTLPFHAEWAPRASREAVVTPPERIPDVSGRWRVAFAKDPDPAVAIFRGGPATKGAIEGTFLTSTGDFRYLAGTYDEHMRLCCFDGAHAFLFVADLRVDGSLAGTFCSGPTWTDTWTAVRDDAAGLKDEFARTRWDEGYALGELQFEALDGTYVSLGDPRFDGRARILQVTGSWCPNCHDETALLAELDRKYRARGLSITALDFELTGERSTDAEAARRMLARHGAEYQALLVGRSDKALARAALPVLDSLFAFPTTIFLGRDGRVRAIHTGFSGPATGEDHARLRADFERRIEELLAEKPALETEMRDHVLREPWRDEVERTFTNFTRGADGKVTFTEMEMTRFDRPTRTEPVSEGELDLRGTTLRMGAKTWVYDRHAHVMLDPSDCSRRMTPGARSPFPVVDGVGYPELPLVLEGLSSGNPIRRRDSAYYLTLQLVADRMTPPEFGGGQMPSGLESNLIPLLDDADPRVRATVSWAVGALGMQSTIGALEKNLAHGYAPVRREAARALAVLDKQAGKAELARLAEHDIDPLVRAAAVR